MSLENIKNLIKNQNISWENINKTLKENNADQETIDQALSVFKKLDKNNDNTISADEWDLADKYLRKADTNQDGKLNDTELSALEEGNVFRTSGAKVTNTFLNAMSNSTIISEKSTSEGVSGGGNAVDLTQHEHDSEGNLITYPLEGETFKKTAERLGFKPGTPEYEEFAKANSQSAKRNWFKVGDQVKIPPSIQDKVNTEGLIDKTTGQAQVDKFNELYSKPPATTPEKINDNVDTSHYPKAIQDKIADLKKSGDTYEISGNNSEGYNIRVTSGNYMSKNKIGEIEIKYNPDGSISTYTQKYNNGKITETTYAGGKKTVIKAEPAPQKYQDIAAQMQKQSGGNARIEYNSSTGHYEVIQTNIEYKNVKEIRTELSDKAWQENMSSLEAGVEGVKDAWNSFRVLDPFNSGKKAINAAMRNRNDSITKEDYFITQTTTYADGRVVEGSYKEGKLKTNKVIKESTVNTEPTQKPTEKLNIAADISFSMPADAPENAKEFADSLVNNKEKLMRQLNIDNDTYNVLAQTAIGIAGKETNFGEMTTRQKAKDVLRNADVVGVRDWSYGITQLKFTLHTQDPTIKRNMEALGITDEKQLEDPEISALATMVVLSSLNKRLDTVKYQNGVEAAQDTMVVYNGWEINNNGIAEKTGNTEAWENNITRQDALCALWNGGEAVSLLNGTFKPQGWEYTRTVREYTQKYQLVENQASRTEAENKEEATRAFSDMTNNGEMGGVVFLPAMYTDKAKHMNSPSEINELRQILTQKGIDPNLRNQLISALQNGELGFDFGLRKDEIESLTNSDIKLLLKHLKELKSKVNNGSINTSDGISAQEAAQLRSKYASTVGAAEDSFRQEYLNNHSKVYNASAENPKILREQSTNTGSSSYVGVNGQRRGFMHEKAKGVNVNTTSGQISNEAKTLAQAAHNVVAQNPNNNNSGYCLTGVKEAMSNAGIDVSEMIKYGSEPKYVKNWFAAHPEMFTPIEYVETGDGTARSINASDLSSLPAGCIVIWEPESGSTYDDQAGHIAITNGNGQGYSDATDNLGWGTYSNNKAESGKGEHGRFVVYKLSDNWEVDAATGKLRLKN